MSKVRRQRRTAWEISGWWALPVMLLASVITVFASPEAGLNWFSLRLAISAFLVFAILNISGTLVIRIAASSKKPREKIRLTARPIMLLVLIVAVLFARLTEIDPALIIGAVLGVDYGSRLHPRRGAIAVLVGFGWSLVIGIAALIGYSWVASMPIAVELMNFGDLPTEVRTEAALTIPSIALWVVVAGEFFAMLAIASLASLPITLLPFAFLDGATVYNWSKWAWGIAYLIGLVTFSLVLAPMEFSWDEPSGTVFAWMLVFVIYAVVATAVWFLFWLAGRKKPPVEVPALSSDSAGSELPSDTDTREHEETLGELR